jgi:HK97 family phage portal protein
MNLSIKSFFGWFGRSAALADTVGVQTPLPGTPLNADTSSIGTDGALQLSTVWACVSLRANIIASLPFFAYKVVNGEKTLARTSRLYAILSDSPNSRMTPYEFWRAMVLNYDLRGNAYARVDRDDTGEAVAVWPMPAEQVELKVLDNGSLVYSYMIGGNIAILAAENVFHMKNLGNGTTGLAKLDYMRATMDEAAKAQVVASKVFSTGGKPSGILMIDKVLNPDQREAVTRNFLGMSEGSTSRLHLLEANMKYEQLSLTPVEQQLMESRKFSVEEICRWFDVPAVLVNHEGLVKYGNNDVVEDIFYKQVIMPLVENIEQAWRKRVMTSRQRASMACEMGMDALLRGSSAKRAEINAKNVQNGLKTRAEIRQLEGDPFIPGTDVLTAQTNLAPLDMLGKIAASGGAGADIAQ